MNDFSEPTFDRPLFLAVCIIGAAFLRIPLLKLLITRDEAASAVSSLIHVLTVYRGPTNHILHELLTQSVVYIGGFNYVSLRTVPFVAGLALIPLMFFFGWSFFNEYTGLLSSLLVMTSYPLIDVSTEAVGYSLLILISTGCYYVTLSIIRSETMSKYVILGILFSIGAYTIPIMIYPAGICIVWIIIQRFRDSFQSLTTSLTKIMVTLITSACFTTLFFLPVILNKGFQFILGNRHLKPEPFLTMFHQNGQLIVRALNLWSGGFVVSFVLISILGVGGSLFFIKQQQEVQSLLSGILLWFSLVFLLHPVDLFKTRFLLYLLPLGYVIISSGLIFWSTRIGAILDRNDSACVIAIGLLIAGHMYTQFNSYRMALEGPTMEAGHRYAHKIRRLIRQHEGKISVHNPFGAIRQKYFLSGPFVPPRFQPKSYDQFDRHIVACESSRPFRHVKRFYSHKELDIIRHRKVYENSIGKLFLLKVTKMERSSLWS